MKYKLKAIALCAAMVAAGSAHADLVGGNFGNSSMVLVAFNQVTNAYYVRDLGYLLNQFLPTGVTTAAGDGAATGDKTPTTGLTLNSTTNASFADSAFGTWLSGQTASDVRWVVSGQDSQSTSATNVSRLLMSSNNPLQTVTNGQITNAVTQVSGLAGALNPMGLSATGATVPISWTSNLILDASILGTLDVASNLYYFTRTVATGASSTIANTFAFGNAAGLATITLASNGNFTYNLAPESVGAVPLPAAAWFMGSGLLALGGAARRRKAAAAAAAEQAEPALATA